jgi:hypothetical protein
MLQWTPIKWPGERARLERPECLPLQMGRAQAGCAERIPGVGAVACTRRTLGDRSGALAIDRIAQSEEHRGEAKRVFKSDRRAGPGLPALDEPDVPGRVRT